MAIDSLRFESIWEHFPVIAIHPDGKRWIQSCVMLGLAPNTVTAYARAVEEFLGFCQNRSVEVRSASREVIAQYVGDLRTQRRRERSNIVRIDSGALRRVQAVTAGWGYRAQCQPLMSLVAELFLIQQRPELESLSLDRLESVRTRWQDSNYRSSLYFQLARALAALGIIASEPKIRNRSNRELARQVRIAGIAHDWVVAVERWEATSTLAPGSRSHGRDAILKAGRWLQDAHPDITGTRSQPHERKKGSDPLINRHILIPCFARAVCSMT